MMRIKFEIITDIYRDDLARMLNEPSNNRFNPHPLNFKDSLSVVEEWIALKHQSIMYPAVTIDGEIIGMGV